MRRNAAIMLILGVVVASPLYELEANDLQSGLPVPLSYYRDKVLLIVNVASQCGYTDSTYGYLNTLHARYASRGLAILAFPCNQFGSQEPGSDDEIFNFAQRKQVGFDLFSKVDVNGPNAHPLFKLLLGNDPCSDDDESCASWADGGECTNNPEFMQASCRRSCKVCTPATDAGEAIRWNFESFLVTRAGAVHARWATGTDLTAPASLSTIEALLASGKDEL